MNNLAKYDSFSDILDSFNDFDFEEYFQKVSDEDIKSSLQKSSLDIFDFLNLLSKKAQNYLEEMAKIAYNHKIRHFGRVIQLYIPIYVSNYCNSNCKYC